MPSTHKDSGTRDMRDLPCFESILVFTKQKDHLHLTDKQKPNQKIKTPVDNKNEASAL